MFQKTIILIHRYLGIGIGLLMILWCVSGIVMMYVQYPEMDERNRLASQEDIYLNECCNLSENLSVKFIPVNSFQIEMMSNIPVLHIDGIRLPVNLKTGTWITDIDLQQAKEIAETYKIQRNLNGVLEYLGEIHNDQWTVYSRYNRHRPLHYFSLNNDLGTELYISSNNGHVVQETTRNQRFWNWIGSVSHWLYFTKLREHTYLWSQTVIWLTIVGIFLTVVGIYLGIRQFNFTTTKSRYSPYKGWHLWHHYFGLIFGLFTLTWIASGLFSMNPWGAFESEGYYRESKQLQGNPMYWEDIKELVQSFQNMQLPPNTKLIEVFTRFGRPEVIFHRNSGQTLRYDSESWQQKSMSHNDWDSIISSLQPGTSIAEAGIINEEDTYYYSHHEEKKFPVYRVIFNNDEQTRYYLDVTSGRILDKIDNNSKWSRWVFTALHRGDFAKIIRTRPIWDIMMLFLLSGVTTVCYTGFHMGLKRVRLIR